MKISKEQENRLLGIRENLDVSSKVNDPKFTEEVVAKSFDKIRSIHDGTSIDGEGFIKNVASNLKLEFEEVRSAEDIAHLQKFYLAQKEIAFGQLQLEFQGGDVDALTIKRKHKPGHYVAVLNLQDTSSRGYWNKAHEIAHRVIEPPQLEMFHRHRGEQTNPVESLVDVVASEIAYYSPTFRPLVESFSNSPLSWSVVEEIRQLYSPTASLMATTKAVIKHWPYPVFLIEGSYRGRKGKPHLDIALRSKVLDRNEKASNTRIVFFSNMRVPETSPLSLAFHSASKVDNFELLSKWTTSTGKSLPSRYAMSSVRPYDRGVLALVSPK